MEHNERNARIREMYRAGNPIADIVAEVGMSASTIQRVAHEGGLYRNGRSARSVRKEMIIARAVWAELTRNPNRTVRSITAAIPECRWTMQFYLAIRQLEMAGYIRSIDRGGKKGGVPMYEVLIGLYDTAPRST